MERFNDPSRRWFDNYVQRTGDGFVPCAVCIDGQAWERYFKNYKDRIQEVASRCPNVDFGLPGGGGRSGRVTVTDKWGCQWLYNETSGDGQCISHPLEDLQALGTYTIPDPDKYLDWDTEKKRVERTKLNGGVSGVGLEHGFYYLRLTYLRGYQNLLLDIAEKSPAFLGLLEAVTDFWVKIAERIAELEPDMVYLGDDLGMQHSLPMSPRSWRELIKPGYKKIVETCKSRGAKVQLHTDGYIVDIIPDLIECGVDVINPQDLVNGIDSLERLAKGKVSINLDIDRQSITPFGTPEEIREHIGNCIKTLGSENGGLSLIYGTYGGVPIENFEAVMLAMQEYHDYWCK